MWSFERITSKNWTFSIIIFYWKIKKNRWTPPFSVLFICHEKKNHRHIILCLLSIDHLPEPNPENFIEKEHKNCWIVSNNRFLELRYLFSLISPLFYSHVSIFDAIFSDEMNFDRLSFDCVLLHFRIINQTIWKTEELIRYYKFNFFFH